MTTAERLINQGIDKGRADMLSKLLALKFGELPGAYHARLADASTAELDTWATRVLTATTLDQVFAD